MFSSLKETYSKKAKSLVAWTKGDQTFTFTGAALFVENKEESKLPSVQVTPPGSIQPDNLLRLQSSVEEGTAFTEVLSYDKANKDTLILSLPEGLYFLNEDTLYKVDTPLHKAIPIRCYALTLLPEECYKHIVSFVTTRNGTLGVKLLDKETSEVCYIALSYWPTPDSKLKFTLEGKKYKPTDWDETRKCYTKIIPIKERKDSKMEDITIDFTELKDKTADKLDAELQKAKKELSDTVEGGDVKQQMDNILQKAIKGIKKEESKVPAENIEEKAEQAAPEEAKEQTGEEEEEASDSTKDVKKNTRKRAAKTTLPDLKPVIDKIGGAVDENMNIEDAMNEFRQLRDLQVVCTRRITNIASMVFKSAADAIKLQEQLKALVK